MREEENHAPNLIKRVGTAAAVTALTLGTVGGATITALADTTTPGNGGTTPTTPEQPATDRTYTVTVGQTGVTLKKNAEGVYEATLDGYKGIPSDTLTATTTDDTGNPIAITIKGTLNTAEDTTVIGVVKQSGSITYTGSGADTSDGQPGDRLQLTVNYAQTVGEKVTLGKDDDNTEFKGGKATAKDATLDLKDKPDREDITLSDGTKLPITWGKAARTPDTEGNRITVTRTGKATGTVSVDKDGAKAEWPVEVDIKAVRYNTWAGTVNKTTKPFTVNKDGSLTLEYDTMDALPGDMSVTGGDRNLTIIPKIAKKSSATTDKLGVISVAGQSEYDSPAEGDQPAFKAAASFAYTVGKEITIKGDGGFKQDGGKYTASYDKFTLDNQNKPDGNDIALSDGTKATVKWDDKTTTVDKDNGKGGTAVYVRLHGTATGVIDVKDEATGEHQQETYLIDVTADRAQDKSLNMLTVTRTDAKGGKASIDMPGFDPAKHEYTLEALPYSTIGDAFTLSADTGVDATVSKPTLTLGAGSERIFHVTVNDVEYTVNVPFQSADIKADSKAKLEGIYVNYTGAATKGQLIDNWNPNRLDYTITLGADSKSPYVLPVAPEGISIQAGDVTQSAQSSKQAWTVTYDATGESRTYTVTANRPVKTAVTEFKPANPIRQDGTVEPSDDQDASLASHGYVTADGKYTPVEGDEYTIPEGGTFSYEPKIGQSATVSSTHTAMTYEYTVTVLPKDMTGYPKQHTYKVTYLTKATHAAQLTGIGVDGKLIGGFDPAKHEYSTQVNDPNEWVVSPQYDKTAGMSVSTVKKGADATITVTSGDGLVSTTYRLHVTRKPFGGKGTVGVGGQLAQTGMSMGVISGILAAIVAVGILIWAVGGRYAKKGEHAPDAEPDDATAQSNDADKESESNPDD